jgi:small subunit ribosomal protein S4e
MKNHLKRIAAPRTWILSRKSEKFTLRPNPGAHKLENGMPIGTILRDKIGLTKTMAEAQKLLNNNEVLVDGKRRTDRRVIVGLFDVISIPSIKKSYVIGMDDKGRLVVNEADEKQSQTKICKVIGKTIIRGGKIQLNLYDGKNIIVDKNDVKVGDSVEIEFASLSIKKIFPLKVGSFIFLTKGKHAGTSGKLNKLEGAVAHYTTTEGVEIETTRNYLYVTG